MAVRARGRGLVSPYPSSRAAFDPDAYMLYGTSQLPYLSDVPPPALDVPADYYFANAKFTWLAQNVQVGPLQTQDGTRAALASALSANGYSVNVVYGTSSWWDILTGAYVPGYVLDVTGSQNLDRNSWLDVRTQIAQLAQSVGFSWDGNVLFNVERAGSPFVATPAPASTTWGDLTPVEPRSIFSELPAPADLLPQLKISWPIFAIGGLLLFAFLKGGR